MRMLLALLVWLPLAAQPPAPKPEEKKAEAPAQPETAPQAKAEAPAPAPAGEPAVSGTFDMGYRWLTDVRGNFNSYRSLVDLGEGPKVFGWDLSIQDPKHRFFDRATTQGNAWGGDPYSSFRLNLRKDKLYDFTFDYRNIAYFNYLPSFADPQINIARGFFLDENSFDLRRRLADVRLDLLPGRHIIPYFAYNRDWGQGHGITTFVGDANEYPVATQYDDSTSTVHGGVRLEFNRFHATLEQGAIDFGDNQLITNSQQNLGNNLNGFGGRQLFLSNLLQKYNIDGKGVYSKVLLTARPVAWADLYGQFLYSQPRTDISYSESANGQFVSLSTLLFYTSQQDLLTAAAKQPHTSANLGAEVRPFHRLRVIESWTTDRLHNASGGLAAQSVLAPPPVIQLNTLLAESLVWNYNRQQVDVLYDLTSKLTLRGGHRYLWGDAMVPAPDLSQTGPFEQGKLRQQVGLAGLNFRATQKLSANFDFEGGAADNTYFRTSLHDYQQMRVRARYQALTSLSLSAYFSYLNNDNPSPGIRYSFLSRSNSLSAVWTPAGARRISLLGEYSRSTLRSDINFIVPQDGSTARSFYRDNAHTATSLAEVALPAYAGMTPKISFGGSLFISSGSRPSSYYQPLARVSLPLYKHVYWNTEWRYYGFGEQFFLYEGFRTHLFLTGLHFAR